MTTVAHTPKKGYRTIRLPLAESEYDRFLTDRSYAKDRLEDLYGECAELFPEAFPWGYSFFGFTEPSITQQLLCRRIRLDQGRTVFTIAPAFVMPSMTGRTQDVDHALFLRRFHVPYWAIAHVFGHDAMYWYRLEQGLGRFSLVGTTVKSPEHLPKDLVADEKHSWLKGARVYIATTAARDCILGASVAPSASQGDLGKSVWRFCQRSAGRGCRVCAGDRQYRWLASHARRLEGPVHPDHGDLVFSPCVSQNPGSGHQNVRRCFCSGPKAGVGGVSHPEQTGFFPASAAFAGVGRDGTT